MQAEIELEPEGSGIDEDILDGTWIDDDFKNSPYILEIKLRDKRSD